MTLYLKAKTSQALPIPNTGGRVLENGFLLGQGG